MKTLILLEEDYYSNSYSKSLNSVLSKILREPFEKQSNERSGSAEKLATLQGDLWNCSRN